ncbi:50S ribosomal protein L10 [Vicingaceae bacterium]|nr:50S ribosomal protein L10 [Vicingaceae bacterium]MDB4061133.1 50S ribosomal protein L10 [Vicingaceae bacterium]MDB9963605.1 50S ribosomal protein L10 [Vicingaceae bacterium]MDC1451324.1 50S ribosomal protein L10 [Vicingaceae bacterium]
MTKQEKHEIVKNLLAKLNENNIFYLADISELDAETSTKLRRMAFKRDVSLNVVKNTLLRKALEAAEGSYEEFYDVLKGNTSILFSEVGNAPAKLIQEFRKKNKKPILKGAYIEEAIFIGDDKIDTLAQIKSKEELIGDIITLLQSPAKNVLSALQSGGSTIAGLVQTLSEKKA